MLRNTRFIRAGDRSIRSRLAIKLTIRLELFLTDGVISDLINRGTPQTRKICIVYLSRYKIIFQLIILNFKSVKIFLDYIMNYISNGYRN